MNHRSNVLTEAKIVTCYPILSCVHNNISRFKNPSDSKYIEGRIVDPASKFL